MKKAARDHRVYLDDILRAIDQIKAYTAEGKETFFADEKTQDAVIRQLAIISEASNKLPSALKASHPTIPWKSINGMRNIMIHEYADTDLVIVWDAVAKDLPPLKQAVEQMKTALAQ